MHRTSWIHPDNYRELYYRNQWGEFVKVVSNTANGPLLAVDADLLTAENARRVAAENAASQAAAQLLSAQREISLLQAQLLLRSVVVEKPDLSGALSRTQQTLSCTQQLLSETESKHQAADNLAFSRLQKTIELGKKVSQLTAQVRTLEENMSRQYQLIADANETKQNIERLLDEKELEIEELRSGSVLKERELEVTQLTEALDGSRERVRVLSEEMRAYQDALREERLTNASLRRKLSRQECKHQEESRRSSVEHAEMVECYEAQVALLMKKPDLQSSSETTVLRVPKENLRQLFAWMNRHDVSCFDDPKKSQCEERPQLGSMWGGVLK